MRRIHRWFRRAETIVLLTTLFAMFVAAALTVLWFVFIHLPFVK